MLPRTAWFRQIAGHDGPAYTQASYELGCLARPSTRRYRVLFVNERAFARVQRVWSRALVVVCAASCVVAICGQSTVSRNGVSTL